MNAHATVADVLSEHDDLEAWRPALAAYYRCELNRHRVTKITSGEPFDYMDHWSINSIKAAIAAAPVMA